MQAIAVNGADGAFRSEEEPVGKDGVEAWPTRYGLAIRGVETIKGQPVGLLSTYDGNERELPETKRNLEGLW